MERDQKSKVQLFCPFKWSIASLYFQPLPWVKNELSLSMALAPGASVRIGHGREMLDPLSIQSTLPTGGSPSRHPTARTTPLICHGAAAVKRRHVVTHLTRRMGDRQECVWGIILTHAHTRCHAIYLSFTARKHKDSSSQQLALWCDTCHRKPSWFFIALGLRLS